SPTSSGLTTAVSAATRSTSSDATITITLATIIRSRAFMWSPRRAGLKACTTSEFSVLNSQLRSSRRPFDVFAVLLVLLADVLHQLFGRPQPSVERHRERLRVVHRIVDRRLDGQRTQVRTRVAFNRVQLLAVRVTAEVEPELVVEANGIDDQRLALVVADRVTVPRRIRIVGVFAAVDEDLPVAVDVALEEHEDVRWRLQQAHRIGRQARNAGRQAVRFGIVPRLARRHQCLPRLVQGNRHALRHALREIADGTRDLPDAGEIRTAVGQLWGRT